MKRRPDPDRLGSVQLLADALEERRTVGHTHTGHRIPAGVRLQAARLDVVVDQQRRRVRVVVVLTTELGRVDVTDVDQLAAAPRLVQRRDEETQVAVLDVLSVGDDAGDQRGGEAGAAVAIFAVRAVGAAVVLSGGEPDDKPGVPVTQRRDVRRGAVTAGVRLADHTLLPGRGGEARCYAATGTAGEALRVVGVAGVRAPLVGARVELVVAALPAGLEDPLTVGTDAQRRTTNSGGIRATRREPGLRLGGPLVTTGRGDCLIARVAGGEVDANAFGRCLQQHVVVGLHLAGGQAVRPVSRPGVTDDRRALVGNDRVQRAEQVHAVGGPVVEDPGARCGGVHGIDVQRLLRSPVGRAISGALGDVRLVLVLVDEVLAGQLRQTVLRAVSVRVGRQRDRVGGVHDRDRLAGAGGTTQAVGRADLGRAVRAQPVG